MAKFSVLFCAAVIVCGSNAALERGRFGIKGGQYDSNGYDASGKDVFGFDVSGVDKWGRPISDTNAGLVAPTGLANSPSTASATATGTVSSGGQVTTTTTTKHTNDNKPENSVDPTPTPSFSGVPITWSLSNTRTSSNFVPTTVIFTSATPLFEATASPACSSVIVFELNECLASDSLVHTGPGIHTTGDFLASGFFLANVGPHPWQFASYECNGLVNKGFVTVVVCGGPSFLHVDVPHTS